MSFGHLGGEGTGKAPVHISLVPFIRFSPAGRPSRSVNSPPPGAAERVKGQGWPLFTSIWFKLFGTVRLDGPAGALVSHSRSFKGNTAVEDADSPWDVREWGWPPLTSV